MTTNSTSYPESEYFTMATLFMLFTILDIPPPPEPPVPTFYPSPFPTFTPLSSTPISVFSPLPPFPQLPPFTPSTTWSPPRPSHPDLKWLRLLAMYILPPTTILVVIFLIARHIWPPPPEIITRYIFPSQVDIEITNNRLPRIESTRILWQSMELEECEALEKWTKYCK
nr:hypothetical protein CFP56_56358 [Quercus suber]